jgi:hypothetical protein
MFYYIYVCTGHSYRHNSCATFHRPPYTLPKTDSIKLVTRLYPVPGVAGIPELEVAQAEPILIDEISIALGSGPDGYRATFKDIEAYGVSNMSIVGVR